MHYLFFGGDRLPSHIKLLSNEATANFEALGSSRFFLTPDKRMLAKISTDKWSKHEKPVKWLLQDYIEDRLFLQTNARMEYRYLNLLRQTGLLTPQLFGWGISFHPASTWASLLLIEYMPNTQPGRAYFEALGEADKYQFLQNLAEQLAKLVKLGYVPRDLHYNNLLINQSGETVWIDTHLRALRKKQKDCKSTLSSYLSSRKLLGQEYKDTLIDMTCNFLR